MVSFFDTAAKGLLFFDGQMDDLLAGLAATAIVFCSAFFALDEKEMTAFVAAIGMGVGGSAALVTAGDDLVADPLPHPVVKNEVLALEFIFEPLLFDRIGVMDDAAFEVEDIVESLVQ